MTKLQSSLAAASTALALGGAPDAGAQTSSPFPARADAILTMPDATTVGGRQVSFSSDNNANGTFQVGANMKSNLVLKVTPTPEAGTLNCSLDGLTLAIPKDVYQQITAQTVVVVPTLDGRMLMLLMALVVGSGAVVTALTKNKKDAAALFMALGSAGTFGALSINEVQAATGIMVQTWSITSPNPNAALQKLEATVNHQTGEITYKATRNGACTVITVPVNNPPVANNDTTSLQSGTSTLIDVLLNDTDADRNTLSIGAITQPAHGIATMESGKIRYTPAAGYVGTDSFTYYAFDGQTNSLRPATVTITVTAAPVLPVTPPTPTCTVDDVANTINCGSLVSSTLEVSTNGGTSWSDFSPTTVYPGVQTVLVRVKAQGINPVSANQTLNFTVNPDTTPDAFTFADQTGVALSTLTTSAPINISGINQPAPISVTGGAYSINSGAFTSTAGTITNGQTVRVQGTSSSLNSTKTSVTLTVGGISDSFDITTLDAPANVAPTPIFSGFTVDASLTLSTSGQLTASDPNPGDTLTYAITAQPSAGTLSTNATGAFTYTGRVMPGTYSFIYTVTDGKSTPVAKTATITVNDVAPVAPVGSAFANLGDMTVSDNAGFTPIIPINTGGVSDPLGRAITYSATGLPTTVVGVGVGSLSINTATGAITGTYDAIVTSPFSVIVTATNGGKSISKAFTISMRNDG